MFTLDQLVADICSRSGFAGGIGIASAYLKSIGDCLSGNGLCPTKLFSLASAEVWQKELADAAQRLTYCGGEMADPDVLTKSIRDGGDIVKGAVLEYDCVLSSRRRDRDGDIIEQKGGLEVDPKMPLLWQHIQAQPIGKHVAVLSQDEFTTKCRFAIADTELGRDAATLVKFGSLRKSHGFKAYEFLPVEIVKNAKGEDVAKGWHIKKGGVMEGSLVSIPANPDGQPYAFYEKSFDGLATAYSRDLLKNPMVKSWAKGIYQARPLVVPGATFQTKATHEQVTGTAVDGPFCPKCGKVRLDSTGSCASCGHIETKKGIGGGNCPKCECGMDEGRCVKCGYMAGKSIDVGGPVAIGQSPVSEKMFGDSNPYPNGSWESIQYFLRRSIGDYLRAKGINVGVYDYCDLVATFNDAAVVACHPSGPNAKSSCYQIGWSSKGGAPNWSGDPKPVEVRATIVDKMLAAGSQGRAAQLVAKQSPQELAGRLMAAGAVGDDAATLKACEDVAAFYSILRKQHEDRELNELLNLS